jgi:hypothetical protein
MAFEQKDMSGALFKNEDRDAEKNQPHYQGSCKIDGVEYWQSAWVKTAKSGKTYMSFSYEKKEAQQGDADKFDDQDMPF